MSIKGGAQPLNPQVSSDHANQFFQHLTALRGYAERVFADGKPLNREENTDKISRMQDYLKTGAVCEFSERQLVLLILGDLL